MRRVAKESAELEKMMKQLSKRSFACEADLKKEIEQFTKTKGKKLKYHCLSLDMEIEEKRNVGRPAKEEAVRQYVYSIKPEVERDEDKIQNMIEEANCQKTVKIRHFVSL